MRIDEVKSIFQQKKNILIQDLKSDKAPIAFLLGGQPSSGKGGLVAIIEELHPDRNFLYINGDNYRIFHPNFKDLKSQSEIFSTETQIFSNVFTEALIKEAVDNNYSVIIEGTMRSPYTPYNTAKYFKDNNFQVQAFAIVAPALFTELGVFTRYQEEINHQGWGRLADLQSHNDAVKGLPNSIDLLYNEKIVDEIHLHSYQCKNHIETYSLNGNTWNNSKLPSEVIEKAREKQLKNKELLQNIINRGNITYSEIASKFKGVVDEIISDIEDVYKNLIRNNKHGGFKL